MVPEPFRPSMDDRGEWTALALENCSDAAACRLTWQQNDSPALNWMLDYLGTATR